MVDSWIYNFFHKTLIKTDIGADKTMDQAAISLPEGVYTTIRTYDKKYALHLKLHLERILEGFEISNYSFDFDVNELRSAITSILNQNCCDLRLRLHVPFEHPEMCYIFAEDLPKYPDCYYANGVDVKTNKLERNNPKAKLTNFIHKSLQEKELIKTKGYEESIIVDSFGNLLEGLTSNFFGVMNNCLYTADDNVLDGITRKIVLELAEDLHINTIFEAIKIKDISKLDEAFITSTSRNIMPVKRINDIPVGNITPGPITTQLMDRINQRIKSETEVITI
ncbi:MAG: hypothetical protein CL609_19375 [Anaerolineaceae bacterium]|nr:hypothetical protein [Anaerolineaceae bacterium]